MSPEELYTRLERAITERLEVAREAVADLKAEGDKADGEWAHDMWCVRTRGGLSIVNAPRVYVYLRHIAANDPAHVIRACERDLRVLRRHAATDNGECCRYCCPGEHTRRDDRVPFPCVEITDMAGVYLPGEGCPQ